MTDFDDPIEPARPRPVEAARVEVMDWIVATIEALPGFVGGQWIRDRSAFDFRIRLLVGDRSRLAHGMLAADGGLTIISRGAGTVEGNEASRRIVAELRQRLGDDGATLHAVAAGTDDSADGLPSLEEARSLVNGLPGTVGDGVVTLRDALRRIARNTQARLFEPPIFPALVKLKLDDSSWWERVHASLGRPAVPGLTEAVRNRCNEVDRSRARRAARLAGAADIRADDPRFNIEPSEHIDKIVERTLTDKEVALRPDSLDPLIALVRRVEEALDVLTEARTKVADGDDDQLAAIERTMDRIAAIIPGVMARLRAAGARVGRVKFRLELAFHAGNGAATVAHIEARTPLPAHWRLRYDYDPKHLDEGVDFCGEVAALHPDIYWADRHVAINRLDRNGTNQPGLLTLTPRVLIDMISKHVDFMGDLKEKTLPDKIGLTLTRRAAADEAVLPREIAGIACAPVMMEDGTLAGGVEGYDEATRTFFVAPPRVEVATNPTLEQANESLKTVRAAFSTFLHDDPADPVVDEDGIQCTDTSRPAGRNEATALMFMMTALQRPVIDIEPGFLVCGARGSGSGAGKGKMVRAVSLMTTGHPPFVVIRGKSPEEDEKRITAALLSGAAIISFDNWNGARINSDAVSTAISETNGKLRPLGVSAFQPVPRAVLAFNGNDLASDGDNHTQFMRDDFDPRTDSPEDRDFKGRDIFEEVRRRRAELLGNLLTIMRWACLAQRRDPEGFAALLASDGRRQRRATRFARWDRMVRLPLLALGCADPAERHAAEKATSPQRQRDAEVLATWWWNHGNDEVEAASLAGAVRALLPMGEGLTPAERARQLGTEVRNLKGTRQDGFHLTEVETDEEVRGRRKRRARWKLVWTGPGDPPPRLDPTQPAQASLSLGTAGPGAPPPHVLQCLPAPDEEPEQ